MGKPKWNSSMRLILFSALKEKFGPFQEWKNSSVDKGFCKDMAKQLGELFGVKLTKDAVEMQVRWAQTNQPVTGIKTTHVWTWVQCKAAASEVGLLSSKDLKEMLGGKK